MGTKDTITKDYMADNRVFADVFNHMLYKGKNIIGPDTLHPLDTTALAVPYGSGTSEVPVQKFRDEFKSLNVMHDDSRIYLLLGIEDQSEPHFAMPVITTVVYFGSDTWNAPRSLHEMLSVQDPEILSMVPDYRINLFSPAEIKDEELDKLQSNLKEVMLFIKYSKDKRKLQELTSQSPGFRSLELKAARVIDSITGINLRFTETEGSVNMCQAVQEMCDDARAEGRQAGLAEGRTAGLAEGRTEGRTEGLQEQAMLTAQRMLQDPRFSPEDISRFSGLSLEDVLKLQKK